ncbi:MAG: cobyric acid synthase [Congregibacter sp.]
MHGALMVQGTSSDAGKSVLVAGLCRNLYRQGVKVCPFKPQNMSLNSAVTVDGGEIGRAQYLQAQAAGVDASVHMNPVLLKPSSDCAAQVILQGKALSAMDAQGFHDYKAVAMRTVLDSWNRLGQQFSVRVVEGAGSPAEINLREGDIANMGFAEAAAAPVVLIADIDRGGVFAQIVGTLALLSPSERDLVKGFVINRFRGDIALLEPGLRWLEEETGKPVLGVLPFLQDLYLDSEDAISTQQQGQSQAQFRVAVPLLPRISNHTDFDALRLHPGVNLAYVRPGKPLPAADLVVLPGSKNVRGDLQFFREQGWGADLLKHLRYGGRVLGICGGYQMLGRQIDDPDGVEDSPGSSPGLDLLPLQTRLLPQKALERVVGTLLEEASFEGYEIHCGQSRCLEPMPPLLTSSDGRSDGAISADGQIAGAYVHGLFDRVDAANALLRWAGYDGASSIDLEAERDRQLDRLADCLQKHLDLTALWRLTGIAA